MKKEEVYFININQSRYRVFDIIYLNTPNGIKHSDICEKIKLSASQIDRVTKELYSLGLIDNKRKLNNNILWSITPKGEKIYENINRWVKEWEYGK